jgi:hypothetical protein
MKALLVLLLVAAAFAQPEDSTWVSYYNGADGWFAFQGPQRAMKLRPADFNLSYPFQVESLKIWWYWGMGSRQDTAFTFRIYEGDGASLLWESETLYAPSSNWSYYGLSTPVAIDSGDFWIATAHRLVNPYAHPYVNVDTGPTAHSYYGTPGAWTLDNVGEFCFFAFVRELQVGVDEGRWAGPLVRPSQPTLVRGVLRLGAGTVPQPGASDALGLSRAELLTADGRRAMQLEPGANDVSLLAPGVYFIRHDGRTDPVRLVR